jgi:F-type H+-transporting ATPase subunit delta
MTAHLVAKNYARALFLAAKKHDKLETVILELDVIKKHFKADFAYELENPTISRDDLVNIMQEISTQVKFCALVTDFFAVVAQNKRLNLFLEIHEEFTQLVKIEKNILSVDLISVNKLTESQLEQIKSLLEKKYLGKTIAISEIINQNILGGFQIRIGSRLIDASLKGQIEAIKDQCQSAIG